MKSKTISPSQKFFIKSFLATGLPFAISLALMDFIMGEPFSLWKFLFMMVFFGLVMGWFFTENQKSGLRRLGVKEFTDENLQPIQSVELSSQHSISEIDQKIKQDKFFSRSKVSFDKSQIKVRKGSSWSSWGEKILINQIEND